jgi:phage shock protein E
MGILDLLGFGKKSNALQEFVDKGAIVLDVRTKNEYADGHISGSKNIPLQILPSKIAEIKKWNKPIIACCRSGMRSAQATSILKQNGIEVTNGGGWTSLQNKL